MLSHFMRDERIGIVGGEIYTHSIEFEGKDVKSILGTDVETDLEKRIYNFVTGRF